MKENEISLVEDELESVYGLFEINPDVFEFFSEGLSAREKSIVKSDLKSKGICICSSTEDFRRDLKVLLENLDKLNLDIDTMAKSIIIEEWQLNNLEKPLKRPLSKSEVCMALNIERYIYDRGYRVIRTKVYRCLRKNVDKISSDILLENGIITKDDIKYINMNRGILKELKGKLECHYLDGDHSEDHSFWLTIHYDCRQFDKDEVLILFAREAEKKLYELGNQEHFIKGSFYFKGGIGEHAIGFMIECFDSKYVFYHEHEVTCRERNTFYPPDKVGTELIRG